MLSFHRITLADKETVERYTLSVSTMLCEHCFTDLYIWEDHYNTEMCEYNGFLLIRCVTFPEKRPIYLAPIGHGDLKAAIQALEEDAASRDIEFQMVAIPEALLPECEQAVGDRYSFDWSEDSADYIYLSEKLSTLSGKKLQSKRNMINRFRGAYDGRWEYRAITPENVDIARAYHEKWCHAHKCARDNSFLGEACAVRRMLDHFERLGMRGGLLYLDGEVIAYTLGCRAREDLYVVQIEKANSEIDGAYQMINQQFVLANCQEVRYVNREEDLGLPGLKQAKQSYKPVMMGKKFFTIPRAEDNA